MKPKKILKKNLAQPARSACVSESESDSTRTHNGLFHELARLDSLSRLLCLSLSFTHTNTNTNTNTYPNPFPLSFSLKSLHTHVYFLSITPLLSPFSSFCSASRSHGPPPSTSPSSSSSSATVTLLSLSLSIYNHLVLLGFHRLTQILSLFLSLSLSLSQNFLLRPRHLRCR